MKPLRISASSYSNTAPLVWSFLYGRNHGKVEVILDNAPSRSAELIAQGRVDAALVPVIAYQNIPDLKFVADVCIGSHRRVRSVCLITKGAELEDVRSVSLDISSQTSITLSRIIFREFLGFEPEWRTAEPDIDAMLAETDAALLIGDPALAMSHPVGGGGTLHRIFDLAELWNRYTGLGFVFAMWMTKHLAAPLDFAAARDEGLGHLDEIVTNYRSELALGEDEMRTYLSDNISYSIDDALQAGLVEYFRLAAKHGLAPANKPLVYAS